MEEIFKNIVWILSKGKAIEDMYTEKVKNDDIEHLKLWSSGKYHHRLLVIFAVSKELSM